MPRELGEALAERLEAAGVSLYGQTDRTVAALSDAIAAAAAEASRRDTKQVAADALRRLSRQGRATLRARPQQQKAAGRG